MYQQLNFDTDTIKEILTKGFIAFDFETSGTSNQDVALEVAAIHFKPNGSTMIIADHRKQQAHRSRYDLSL